MSIVVGHIAVSKGCPDSKASIITQKWFGDYRINEGVSINGGKILGVEGSESQTYKWEEWSRKLTAWERDFWSRYKGHDVVEHKVYLGCATFEDAEKVFNGKLCVLADGVIWSPFTISANRPTHFRELTPVHFSES